MNIEYCVYELWSTLEEKPFYVGWTKRKNMRFNEHLRGMDKTESPNFKHYKMKKILENGGQIEFRPIFTSVSRADSIQVEVLMIALWGRRDIKTGCLVNMTNGGDGFVAPAKHFMIGKTWDETFGSVTANELRRKAAYRLAKRNKSDFMRNLNSKRCKGKSLEEINGKEAADRIKKSVSDRQTGNKIWLGKKHRESSRELIRQSRLKENRVTSVETSDRLSRASLKRNFKDPKYLAKLSAIRKKFKYSDASKLRMKMTHKLISYEKRYFIPLHSYRYMLSMVASELDPLNLYLDMLCSREDLPGFADHFALNLN